MFKPGQIAEYGSKEYADNQSLYTVIEEGTNVNPHGIERKAVLYHRSAGFKPAGSCGTYTAEVYGYSIQYEDGTTGGKYSSDFDYVLSMWANINNKL